jgi:flagellar M-ring protein FliF
VHLVRPEPTPFVREQKPATASVVLKLKPGNTLNRTTAAGIAALVSRSVEGLSADNVTLLDTNGHMLLAPNTGDGNAPAATQMDYRKDLETYLSNRAEEMLAQLLGPGRAVVRVTAEVNLQHQKTKRETYDPDQRVLVRETVTNRKANAGTAGGRGIPGAGSNLVSASRNTAAAATVPGGTNENEENTDSEWRAGKIEQELDDSRGTVERLTIAALVDLSHVAEGQQPLTVAQTEDIIKQAVGFKNNRDEIKISDVRLASGAVLENVEAEYLQNQRWQWYLKLAKNVSTGIGAVVVLVVALLVYRRLSARAAVKSPVIEAGATSLLIQLAQENPERIARALEAWIDEVEQRVRVAA